MLSLKDCLSAARPLIFCVGESDTEILKYLNENFPQNKFLVYSTTLMKSVDLKTLIQNKFCISGAAASNKSTLDVLDDIQNSRFQSDSDFTTHVFLDADSYIQDKQTIRKIKDIVARYEFSADFTTNMIFISQAVCVPPKLERLSEVVFFDLPSETTLKDKALEIATSLELSSKKKMPSDEVLNNLKGLTLFELEQAFLQSYTLYEEIRLEFIRDFKKSAIAKSGILSLLESDITFNDIGGMTYLKEWIEKSGGGWTVEGKKFGLPPMKGLLMVGLSGCGKSLVAKALGNIWKIPVIQFDPGRVFSQRVGESEGNIRRVLQIVENVSPCLMGDTRITLADGQVASIKELYDNSYRGKVISINDKFNLDTSNVKLITKKQSSDVYNIRTSIGNIKATGNHKFPILKSNGEMHWVEVDNISKNDFIVCPRKVNIGKIPSIMDYFSSDTRFYSKIFCGQILSVIKKKDKSYYSKQGRRIRGYAKNNNSGAWDLNRHNGFVFKHELIKFNIDTSDLSHVYKISRGKGGFCDSSLSKLPSIITEDLMYVLGLLWSDGNIGDRGYWYYDDALKGAQKTNKYRQQSQNNTHFFNNEVHLHDEIDLFLSQTFGVSLSNCFNGERNITSYGIPLILAEFFRRLQKSLLSMPDKYVWAWLSGVLDGDGHIHKQRINYAATKHLNNEYLRDVFLRVGIPISNTKDDFKSHIAELTSAKFIEIFKKNTYLRHPKKNGHLKLLAPIGAERKCRFDTIDVRNFLIKILIERDFIANYDMKTHKKIRHQTMIKGLSPKINKDLHEYLERNRELDIDKIRNIFQSIGAGDQWFFENFFFARVKELDKIHGFHDVYDLCLDKNHNFIANRMFTHNCVLMIDEIEKGFAGMQSSTFSDAGVTARVIGSFLTWMQDCTKPVFTVATSNAIQYCPPELISRFDETFFVNIPQHGERKIIFEIHIKKLGRDVAQFDIAKLADSSEHLSGREIEQVLREAMYDAFHIKKELTTDIILKVLRKKTNLLTAMAEQLDYLMKWVGYDEEKQDGIRARFASPIDSLDLKNIRTEIDSLLKDVEKGKGPKT